MKGDVQKLLADYRTLEQNTFWYLFLDEMRRKRSDILESLGNGESLTLEKIKHKQGQSAAYRSIEPTVDALVSMLKEKSG